MRPTLASQENPRQKTRDRKLRYGRRAGQKVYLGIQGAAGLEGPEEVRHGAHSNRRATTGVRSHVDVPT